MPLIFRVLPAFALLTLTACAVTDTAVRNAQLTEDQIVRTDPGERSNLECKYTRVTGSQIPKLQCFTHDEIAQMEADAKARLRNASRRGYPRDH